MEKMMLSEIAKFLGTETEKEAEITSVSTDTRDIQKGCVFVAIKGERFDGHDFAIKAVEAGAEAVISEKRIEGIPCLEVDSTRKAYLELAGYYREKFNPVLVGVTGSVGKTTTKEMIALVLSEKYNTLKTSGNLNNEIGLPKTLFNLSKNHEAAVIEMGMSDFGEIERLSRTAKPTIGVITNIGFSHIENLHSQQGILQAKLEILRGMDGSAPLIVNADDVSLYPLTYQLGREVISYGILNPDSDYRACDIKEDEKCTCFNVVHRGGSSKVILPCIGRHNIMNALAAFIVGIKAGLDENEIVQALNKYKTDGIRQNIVEKNGQTIIIDCYNASPDSMRASLSVLSQIKSSRKIAVLGSMLELGEMSQMLHEKVAEFAYETEMDKLFCYGDECRFTAQRAAALGIDVEYINDKKLLAAALREYLRPQDAVLFKGSRGMKLEEVIDMVYGNQEA